MTGIEPVFNDRLNPGNNLLVRITVSRYWRYYVVGYLPECLPTLCRCALMHNPDASGGWLWSILAVLVSAV